jgi:hypothetical protein
MHAMQLASSSTSCHGMDSGWHSAFDGIDQLGHVDDATCILDALFEQARVV